MHGPTILLLDVMDTLVRDPFRDIPAFFDMSWPELMDAKHPDAWVRFERAEMTKGEFLCQFFADGRTFDHDAFETMLQSGYAWLPGIETLLGRVRDAGRAELHTLSNYPEWYTWIERKLALSRFVSWSFVSCTVGLRKPDPALYEHVLRTLDVPAERCLFVDDRETNLAPARALGMHTHRFEDAEVLEAWLVEKGVLPFPTHQR